MLKTSVEMEKPQTILYSYQNGSDTIITIIPQL